MKTFLRDDQVEACLERYGMAGAEIVGLRYDRITDVITINVKAVGVMKVLTVPDDVRGIAAPERDKRRRRPPLFARPDQEL